MTGDGAQNWVETGLAELARSGIAGVRVEVLAAAMGVTKGGFYRRFKDRRALLDAMLDDWKAGRIAAINEQMALGGLTPNRRLREVIRLFAQRPNAEGLAIELAIRQWARSDGKAAAAAAEVDAGRIAATEALYARMGFAHEEAKARSILFYAFVFGRGLIFLEASDAEREALIATCEDALTDVLPASAPRA